MNRRSYLKSLFAALCALITFANVSPVLAQETSTVLITGSNRGIGLELARVYAQRGWTVIATCRTPSAANDLIAIATEHSNVKIEELDVTDENEIAALVKKYEGQPIDVLLNNAGIPGDSTRQAFGAFDFELYQQVMAVNVHGPLRLAQAFLPNVEASTQKKIINISSTQGSIERVNLRQGMGYFYRSSKSALNMTMHMLALQLESKGVTVGLVSPGWVDTNFGGMPSMRGMISPQESAQAVTSIIDDYGLEKTGQLISHKGEVVPW